MKLRIALILALLALQFGAATGEAPAPTEAPSSPEAGPSRSPEPKSELAERLDTIVGRAIDARILQPPGSAALGPGARPVDAMPLEASETAPERRQCPEDAPLDLSAMQNISWYSDLSDFAADTSSSSDTPMQGLLTKAKAELALGLNAEALVTLREVPAIESEPLVHLLHLMQRREPSDIAYFDWLARCEAAGNLWLAVALLAEGRADGASLIAREMNAFRALPLHLRADVAMLIVPSLSENGETGLSDKLIAAFSRSEIDELVRLQFIEALIDLYKGKPGADESIRAFLSKPEFQIDALSALGRRGAPLSAIQRAVLADEMTRAIASGARTREVAFALDFALSEMAATSDYELVHALTTLPSLQSEQSRSEIRRRFAESLRKDLKGQDLVRKLLALDALINENGILSADETYIDVFNLGQTEAQALGQLVLAERIGAKIGRSDELAEQRARSAYAARDDMTLHSLAGASPTNQKIILLAALRAVDAGASDLLKIYEPILKPDQNAITALIEEDALTGRWIVSSEVYTAARAIEDVELAARVKRVLEIRAAGTELAKQRPEAIADVGGAISKSGQTLDALLLEAR